ncbi:uncharacterized protein N7459_008750 [Penicillium hispanicum]|uniref:uncharacterized protein n=1 Tax=Penicillium hispanicum TaxID=1080232 RepID=UPI0025404846|nr:uncharacterized protein N7459_008750 [Penicillium hispanicum]KAJ5574323.1 hypothetical protein N7459_008750 [Penicillium hispanicum]
MTTTAEVIVLSSSPIPRPRTPSRPSDDFEKLLEASPRRVTPPPSPSPSKLLQPATHSRFFPKPQATDATKKKRPTTKTTKIPSLNQKDGPSRPQQRTEKDTAEPKSSVLGDLEPGTLHSRDNIVRKGTGCQQKRSRSRKSKDAGNMTLSGKVTKPSSDLQVKKPKKTKKTASSQSSSENPSESIGAKNSNALGPNEDLQLDRATRRRMKWTPPRDTDPKEIIAVDDADVSGNHELVATSGFGNLLADYNYSGSASESRDVYSNTDSEGPTKRRRIELVNSQLQPLLNSKDGQKEDSSSSSAQPKRKPKSQKRFTTLTARMTAQYTSNTVDDNSSIDGAFEEGVRPKPRRRKVKPTEENPPFTVLSPEAAAKTLNEQDLVFGTCSQLEREDSPGTLREMQQAIRASESLACESKESESKPTRAPYRLTGTRNLWRVAARDAEGSLVQATAADTVDLTGRPQASRSQDDLKADNPLILEDDDWFDLDYGKSGSSKDKKASMSKSFKPAVDSQLPVNARPTKTVKDIPAEATSDQQSHSEQPSRPQYSGFTDAELSKQVAIYGFKSVRGRKKMIELLEKCWESKNGNVSRPVCAQPESQDKSSRRMAASEPQNDNIAAPIAAQSIHSKGKVKPKQGTSALSLSKDSQKTAEPVNRTSSKQSTQKISSGARASSSSFIDVDEIQDSEEEIIPSPSRVQQRYTEIFSATSSAGEVSLDIQTREVSTSPTKRKTGVSKPSRSTKAPQSVSTTVSKNSTSAPKHSNLPDLYTQITQAVREQSRIHQQSSSASSRSRPTWHEKILMYDPIVLEDFTKWLNVKGLGLVGEDREVAPTAVREWCESKGICCCWKNATW